MQAGAEGVTGGDGDYAPDLDPPGSDPSLCYRAMCIPKWIWRKIAVHMPVSSRLLLAGVCVSLREYQQPTAQGSTSSPESAHAQHAAAAAGPAGTSGVLFQPPPVLTTERPTASTSKPVQQQTASTGSHQRQEAAEFSSARPAPTLPGIVATHTLLRQWGAEVTVTILPPGWETRASPDAQHTADVQLSAPGQPVHLHTRALNRLNSIWESQEGSGDDGTPTSSSGVRSLFNGQSNGHPGHGQAEPGSPGLLFTNRQTNPLCELSISAILQRPT